MSIRLELLQVARLARKVLGDSAELVVEFLRRHQCPDGGFKDRAGRSDLYYTGFGIDSFVALQSPLDVPALGRYLRQFDDVDTMDFVHLCSFIRCWAAITSHDRAALEASVRVKLLRRVEQCRSADGGYNPIPQKQHGTAYGAFLAMGAYQDVGALPPDLSRLAESVSLLRADDGGWGNERGFVVGSTNATAAAVAVLRQCSSEAPRQTDESWREPTSIPFPISSPAPLSLDSLRPGPEKIPIAKKLTQIQQESVFKESGGVDSTVGEWLMKCAHPEGGFRASPNAPIPDLLSTATALHALSSLEADLGEVKERCLDFVDSLWTNEGSFHGNWTDDHLDCEYTYYGLLALGHLA